MSRILHGCSSDIMREMEAESIDLVCTDPPYGYSFMGKEWDKAVPPVDVWRECLRVLKPGAFAFVMSAPRSDVCSQMVVRLTEAGFRTDFTPIYWTYLTGFPKAANIGKLVDKRNGCEREIVGKAENFGASSADEGKVGYGDYAGEWNITAPASPEAKALDGSYAGYQPKPAVEVVIVAMKPLAESTYVDQALANRKGVTWLDAARVPTSENLNGGAYSGGERGDGEWKDGSGFKNDALDGEYAQPSGRFPANLLVSDNALGDDSRYFDLDAWSDAQLAELPRAVRDAYPFLVVPKPSKGEKDEGCEGFEPRFAPTMGDGIGVVEHNPEDAEPKRNHHPTVKPLTLMRYLVTIGSRAGDTVLDPFVGSGTTAIAAEMLGRDGIGIEREDEYAKIAQARLDAVAPTLF